MDTRWDTDALAAESKPNVATHGNRTDKMERRTSQSDEGRSEHNRPSQRLPWSPRHARSGQRLKMDSPRHVRSGRRLKMDSDWRSRVLEDTSQVSGRTSGVEIGPSREIRWRLAPMRTGLKMAD